MNYDVSVVIPSYNYAQFLPHCIESVKRQKGVKVEIIVVDDFSKDDSVKIARELGVDVLVDLTENYGNAGYKARNDGIVRANAERIVCLDADDMLTPDSLRTRCVALSRTEGFVCGRAYKLPMNDSKIITYDDAIAECDNYDELPIPLRWLIKPQRCKSMQMSTLMSWKRLFKEYGLYDEGLPGWNDRELWARWLYHREVGHFIGKFLSFRRMHSGQVTKSRAYHEHDDTLRDKFEVAVKRRKASVTKQNTRLYKSRVRRKLVDPEEIVIYTAIFGGKDKLWTPKCIDEGVDYVCFTDNKNMESQIWDVRICGGAHNNPNLSAKYYRVFPHKIFPKKKYSIWIDGNLQQVSELMPLVNRYLGEYDIATFRRKKRLFITEEVRDVLKFDLEDPEKVKAFVKLVCKQHPEKIYEGLKLFCPSVTLRRHENIDRCMEEWWKLITEVTIRDEMTLSYALLETNILHFHILEDFLRYFGSRKKHLIETIGQWRIWK